MNDKPVPTAVWLVILFVGLLAALMDISQMGDRMKEMENEIKVLKEKVK